LRGKAFLARKITRTTVKGNGARKPDSPESETPLPSSSKTLAQSGAEFGATNPLKVYASNLPLPLVPTGASVHSNGMIIIAALSNAIAAQKRMGDLSNVLADALATQPTMASLHALRLLGNRSPSYQSQYVIGNRSAVASSFAPTGPATSREDPRIALLRKFYE